MKKIIAVLLAAVLLISCFAGCSNKNETQEETASAASASNLKIGVILVGDETEGYTLAHMDGIKAAAKELGIADDNIVWKPSIPESDQCYTAAQELVAQGCQLIVSNSYGHQNYMSQAAEDFPDVNFVAMTGDYAAISKLDNFYNAFTKIYEARYVSGVVAGMKVAELVKAQKLSDKNIDTDGNVKIGYVGAYPYAEVVSGYTAFYLGVKSVYDKVSMEVQYTNSWFDIEGEAAAAETLMADGCVIISQHADSTGAPTAVEKAYKNGTVAYSVGYNVSMLDVAKDVALTSATNNWSVCYKELFAAAASGDMSQMQDWAKGYDDNAVAITELGTACAEGTDEKVKEVESALKDGSLKVFDTSKFTVEGKALTTSVFDFSNIDFATGEVIYQGEKKECIITDGDTSYFDESSFRAAPYFDVRIDGITELNAE